MIDVVPAARARQLITWAIEAVVTDMQVVHDGTWARALTDEISAVVRISSLKGGQYDLEYGVCCAWVPKSGRTNRLGRFPRTFSQTTLHLWVDHFTPDAPPRQWLSTLDGERATEKSAAILGRQVSARAPGWWRSMRSPADVLAEAGRQAHGEYDIHNPRARVVAAFTLARLGDIDAARTELDDESDDLVRLLTATPIPHRP